MNRNELKRLLFSIDYSNVKESKKIIVETDFGHVEIRQEGPGGFSTFKTSQGENALQWAIDRINSDEKYKEYELIVK